MANRSDPVPLHPKHELRRVDTQDGFAFALPDVEGSAHLGRRVGRWGVAIMAVAIAGALASMYSVVSSHSLLPIWLYVAAASVLAVLLVRQAWIRAVWWKLAATQSGLVVDRIYKSAGQAVAVADLRNMSTPPRSSNLPGKQHIPWTSIERIGHTDYSIVVSLSDGQPIEILCETTPKVDIARVATELEEVAARMRAGVIQTEEEAEKAQAQLRQMMSQSTANPT